MPVVLPPFSLFNWITSNFETPELWVHLCKNNPNWDRPLQLSDFVEPTFWGYAPFWFKPEKPAKVVPNRYAEVVGQLAWWEDSGDAPHSEIIEGYFVVARYPDGSSVLVVAEKLERQEAAYPGSPSFGVLIKLTAAKIVLGA